MFMGMNIFNVSIKKTCLRITLLQDLNQSASLQRELMSLEQLKLAAIAITFHGWYNRDADQNERMHLILLV